MNLPLLLTPSKKKVISYVFIFLLLATLCFFVEIITNKITQGTYLIKVYESIIFYLFATYFLVQLIPGYAKLIIDKDGFREVWFFRERIKLLWSAINFANSKLTRSGDTLYINTDNEQLFSRKLLSKGTYSLSDKQLLDQIMSYKQSKSIKFKPQKENITGSYLLLGNMRLTLMVVLSLITLSFNTYYLTNESPNQEFKEQVIIWQNEAAKKGLLQHQLDEQLFESFKIYGFYWKQQLKQFDRKLFHQILLQESKQIEKALIKQKQAQQLMLEDEKAQFHLLLEQCKDRFLFYDEDMYLQCLEKL